MEHWLFKPFAFTHIQFQHVQDYLEMIPSEMMNEEENFSKIYGHTQVDSQISGSNKVQHYIQLAFYLNEMHHYTNYIVAISVNNYVYLKKLRSDNGSFRAFDSLNCGKKRFEQYSWIFGRWATYLSRIHENTINYLKSTIFSLPSSICPEIIVKTLNCSSNKSVENWLWKPVTNEILLSF